MKAALAVILAAAACGSPRPTHVDRPEVAAPMDSNLEIASEEITFPAGSRTIPGTYVHPTKGKHPALVLMAGSGPTDRDWNSPLLEGKNGSAKLLAEALAKHGIAVLRFDKAATGGNAIDIAKLTIDTYVDEGRGALAFVRARPDVDPAHLFIAGHSEGGIHAMRVAVAEGKAVAGLVLLSAPGRSMMDLMIMQLENQFTTAVARGAVPKATADAELTSLKQAFADFLAGKPVDPTKASQIPQVQQLVAQIVAPQTAALSRPLLGFDPPPALAKVTVPVFIYNGLKDIQVDPELDAKRLAGARPDATLYLAADANHVLKHETHTVPELRADLVAAQTAYNAAESTLDQPTVDALAAWLVR